MVDRGIKRISHFGNTQVVHSLWPVTCVASDCKNWWLAWSLRLVLLRVPEFARCVELPLSDCLAGPKCGQGPPCLHVPPAEVNRFGWDQKMPLFVGNSVHRSGKQQIHTNYDCATRTQTTARKPTSLAQTASNPQTFLVLLQKVVRDTPADLFVTPSTFLFVPFLTRTRRWRRGRVLALPCVPFLWAAGSSVTWPMWISSCGPGGQTSPLISTCTTSLSSTTCFTWQEPWSQRCCWTCLRYGPWLKFLQI